MRILITGVGGFVGRHLLEHIQATTVEAELHGTVINHSQQRNIPGLHYHEVDLKNEADVLALIDAVRPHQIYHLAAQASPRASFNAPWETLENNIRSQVNIFQACVRLNIQPRTLIISSAEIYGPIQPEQLPVREEAQFRPTSPYGVSKVAQDMLGLQYHLSYGLPVVRARPFNHIGPGQSEGFVAVDFAIQIARIENGQQVPVMEVGNLKAERDFTDVRDVVRAYRMMMEADTAGMVFNVASGESHSIQSLLDILLAHSTIPIEVRIDPQRMMPIDVPVIRGDFTKLRTATGWQPSIPFEQTLVDVLNDCRARVQRS